MAEVSCVLLNVLCPDLARLFQVFVPQHASTVDIAIAVAQLTGSHLDMWLIPPGKWRLAQWEQLSDMRDAVPISYQERRELGLIRSTRTSLEEWWPKVKEDDVHIVARPFNYPGINVFDVGSRTRTSAKPLLLIANVASIIPEGKEDYDIYQFPEGTDFSSEDELEHAIEARGINTLKKLQRFYPLSTLAPRGFIPGQLHFVIVPCNKDEENNLQPLPFTSRRLRYLKRPPPISPSSQAQASEFRAAQESEGHRIYCGRPYHRSTPPSLLDETLCQLRCNLDEITPTPKDVQCYQALCANACQNLTEDERRERFTNVLAQKHITPARANRGHIGATRYYDDGDLRTTSLGVEVIYYVQEIEREIGNNAGDPFVKAIHNWIENIRSFFESLPKKDDAETLNFPAVLVLHFGPYLGIAAAVYGEDPIVELLCCIPMHVHDTNYKQLRSGERAVAALRVALHSLRDRYADIAGRGPRADFPFRDFYEDADRNVHAFTYDRDIDKKRIFRALENGTPLCVKFTTRYSAQAHQFAQAAGFAPALRAVNMFYDWIMIVMEDKAAEYSNTMWDMKHGIEAEKETGKGKAPIHAKPAVSLEEAQAQVRAKLELLHQGGFVHGDVRDVNVLVRNEGAPAGSPDILIVDWDWAGRAGEVVYPRNINTQLARPEEALAAEVIKAEHDVWMADRLLD